MAKSLFNIILFPHMQNAFPVIQNDHQYYVILTSGLGFDLEFVIKGERKPIGAINRYRHRLIEV